MAQNAFQPGCNQIQEFFAWINERHQIYHKRFVLKKPKPWTEDEIMLTYKFTNVFRELDRGTLALRLMERDALKRLQSLTDPDQAFEVCKQFVFNTFWYRTFNRAEHAKGLGWVTEFEVLEDYFKGLLRNGDKIFTGAHMVRGDGGEIKLFPYLRLLRDVWDSLSELTYGVLKGESLEQAFSLCMDYHLVGKFNAYELVCDWQWNILNSATDKLTWGSIGPGAARGLERLGLPMRLDSMLLLWKAAGVYLSPLVKKFYPAVSLASREPGRPYQVVKMLPHADWWPLFDMRAIEHSLCEFDKYSRCKAGEGRPRQRYDGR